MLWDTGGSDSHGQVGRPVVDINGATIPTYRGYSSQRYSGYSPRPTTAYWQRQNQTTRATLQNGGITPGTAFIGGGRPLDPATERPYIPTPPQRRRRNWARWVEQNGTLRLIPYDEDALPESEQYDPFIGFVQDWGNGSFVMTQVDDRWRKRRLTYRRGAENLNPQIALGWSPQQVTQWRDQVRYLTQWMDLDLGGAPFGVTGNDWTSADAAAMEWFMAWSNENGTTVEQATETWLAMAQDGSLDNWGEQEGEGGGSSAPEPPPLERRVERVFTMHDLDDARALLTQQITSLLGRAPQDREVSEFLTALNTRAKANPTVTTYDYTYDEFGRNIETETTVDPGRGIDTVAMARKASLAGNRGEMERYHLGLAQDVLAELAGM